MPPSTALFFEALVAEHQPSGPTEEHLVEELAGILWRKRRLRLAEAAAIRQGLPDATVSSRCRWTAERAMAHLRASATGEELVEAVQATPEDTASDLAALAADEAQTLQAIAMLKRAGSGPTTGLGSGRLGPALSRGQFLFRCSRRPQARTCERAARSYWWLGLPGFPRC